MTSRIERSRNLHVGGVLWLGGLLRCNCILCISYGNTPMNHCAHACDMYSMIKNEFHCASRFLVFAERLSTD